LLRYAPQIISNFDRIIETDTQDYSKIELAPSTLPKLGVEEEDIVKVKRPRRKGLKMSVGTDKSLDPGDGRISWGMQDDRVPGPEHNIFAFPHQSNILRMP
jgi:hypothetical protein